MVWWDWTVSGILLSRHRNHIRCFSFHGLNKSYFTGEHEIAI